MKHYAFVMLFLSFVTALRGASPAVAQNQPAITIDVQAGYDGAYRLGDWLPVVVTVANDGPDVRGVLEWRFAGHPGEAAFQRAIDLPRGSRKRVTIAVFARDLVRSGQVRLLDNGRALAEQSEPLEAIDEGRFLSGVLSSDPALLNSLNSLALSGAGGATVRHLDAALLPENTAALRGVDALFLHDVDTNALTPAQHDTLALWVQLGGQLVISGGGNGQRTAAAVADLLPVEVTGGIAQGDLAPLGNFAGTEPPQGTAALSEVRPREGAESLPSGAGLVFRWKRGAGTVIFTTFDLAGLRGWNGEPRLWGRLLEPVEILAPGVAARERRFNLLQAALRLPSLGLPSASVLLLFLLVYIFVIGPLNYLVLRRLRRLEWAWLTVPTGVLLFAGGLYVVGFGLRGGQSQVDQVAIVQGSEGQSRGFVTAFAGLFSPRRANYALAFPADMLVSETQTWNDLSGQLATVLQTDAGAEVPEVLVDVGSVRTFMAEGTVNVPISIQSDVHTSGGQLGGQIRNTGSRALEDATIVRGTAFQWLGTIAPGASHSIAVSGAGNFPWAIPLPRTGLFDRQQLLTSLFQDRSVRFPNPNNPNNPMIDEHGVYLLAWSSTPGVVVRVDGQEAAQDGLTLYIIRLDGPADSPLPARSAPATGTPTAGPTPSP